MDTLTTIKTPKGMICRLAIQCKAPCGKVGDFLFSGVSPKTGTLRSPVFESLADLYPWIKKNGFEERGVYQYKVFIKL